MSNLLQLAQALQQKSQEELNNTNELVKSAIKQHEQNLIEQLQNASKTIENAIQSEKTRLIRRTIAFWRLPSIIIGGICLIALLATIALSWRAKQSYQAMQEWQQMTENYQAISQSLKIKTCEIKGNPSQYCIEIDQAHKGKYWGEKANLAILPVKVKE